MVKDLEIIKNIALLDGKEIVIWGAGNGGKDAYEEVSKMIDSSFMGKDVQIFCDSDPEKWGREQEGRIVISPEELARLVKTRDILLLIASKFVNDILIQIKQLDIDKYSLICTRLGVRLAVIFNIKDNRIRQAFRKEYLVKYEFEKRALEYSYFREIVNLDKSFLCTAINSDDALYILQPGKVGSTTVVRSLEIYGKLVVHTHNLFYEKDGSRKYRDYCKKMFEEIKERPIKIISLVREPISRDISSFWAIIKNQRFLYSKFLNKDFMEFYDQFLEYAYGAKENFESIPDYVKDVIKWGDQGEWFKETILEWFGLDVFSYPFDKEKGYAIIQKDNIQMLILQMEKLNKLEDIIGDFAGVEGFKLQSANQTISSGWYPMYKEFQEKLVLTKEYLEHCYGPESYVQHFYSKEDQDKFLQRWKYNIK